MADEEQGRGKESAEEPPASEPEAEDQTSDGKTDAEAKAEAPEAKPDAEPQGEAPEAKPDAEAKAEAPEAKPDAEPKDQAPEAKLKAEASEPKPKPKAEAEAEAEAKDDEPSGPPPPPPGSIADLIAQALPDITIEAEQSLSHVTVAIAPDDIPKAMPVLKDDPRLDLKLLRNLFAVDHQEDGLDVIYQLLSLTKNHEVAVRTRLPKDDPKVASVTAVWNAANWHERETRDMFGIDFEDHPHLIPLLLPEDMTDHFPLRKDNPLAEIEEWQAEFLEGNGAGGDDEPGEEE